MDGKVNLNFCVESALGIDVVWFDRVERWWESMEIFFFACLGLPKAPRHGGFGGVGKWMGR